MSQFIGLEIADPVRYSTGDLGSAGDIAIETCGKKMFVEDVVYRMSKRLALNPLGVDYPAKVPTNDIINSIVNEYREEVTGVPKNDINLGVGIPSSTPPIVRTALAELFEIRQGFVAIETPFAAALEWGAMKHETGPFLFVTQGIDYPECTLIVIANSADTLTLESHFSSEVADPNRPLDLPRRHGDIRLVVSSTSVLDFAQDLARALEIDSGKMDVADTSIVSRGACRYAGYLYDLTESLGDGLHGTDFSELEILRCCVPWDLGLLAGNGDGDTFWSRMNFFEEGEEFFACQTRLRKDKGSSIWVASCPPSTNPRPDWLLKSQWAQHDLRFFHQIIPIDVESDQLKTGLHLRGLRNRKLWKPTALQVSF